MKNGHLKCSKEEDVGKRQIIPPDMHRSSKLRWSLVALCLVTTGVCLMIFGEAIETSLRAIQQNEGLYVAATRQMGIFKVDQNAGSASGFYTAQNTFRLYNLSFRSLKLNAVADCSCSDLSWNETKILPFHWADLTMKMKMKIKASVSHQTAESNIVLKAADNNDLHQTLTLVAPDPSV